LHNSFLAEAEQYRIPRAVVRLVGRLAWESPAGHRLRRAELPGGRSFHVHICTCSWAPSLP